NPDDYEWSTTKLDQVAAYVKAKQTAGLTHSVNVNQGVVTSPNNLLPNSSFNSGISGGWTTDDPANIVADSGNNGSYPDTTYAVKNFLNVQAVSNGGVGFYVDEYDVNGHWVSGQYKKTEPSVFVENMNFNYKPSSAAVASASLQVIVSGAGINAYLDNT